MTLRPSPGSKAQQPAAGCRLQERAPARRERPRQRRGRRSRSASAAARAARVIGRSVSVSPMPSWSAHISALGHAEVAEPHGTQPVDPRGERPDQLRQLVRGDEVQRAAHRPGLDERPLAPQGVAHGVPGEAVDPGVERELGRAHDLGVDGNVVPDNVEPSRRREARSARCWRSSRRAARRSQVVSIMPTPYRAGRKDVTGTRRLLRLLVTHEVGWSLARPPCPPAGQKRARRRRDHHRIGDWHGVARRRGSVMRRGARRPARARVQSVGDPVRRSRLHRLVRRW